MKGIIFKPESIQAIIEGRKTQTRRLIKPQPLDVITDKTHKNSFVTREINGKRCWCAKYEDNPPRGKMITSRYHIGETVYIKEAWSDIYCSVVKGKNYAVPKNVLYAMDYPPPPKGFKWLNPLFMPEWAARYFIVIEQVRAERLQEITYGDCIAEGLDMSDVDYIPGWDVSKFKSLWNTINPKYPWESNPWVFPYTFRLENK